MVISMIFDLNRTLKQGCYAAAIIGASVFSPMVYAQATFLIWPIYPKIEANEKAAAVWLENTGKSDAMVQIRVFKWDQKQQQDSYNEQNEVIASPPIAKIKAGEKHMLRLTRAAQTAEGQEVAYRVIVDELPIQLDEHAQDTSKVSFQMRYSIPLFVYGNNLGSGLTQETQKINAKNHLAQPILTWWIKDNAQGKTELYIKNSGLKFARLSGIKSSPDTQKMLLGNEAFGYILAQSTMKFDVDQQFVKQLEQKNTLYAVDSSGVQQENIEIKRGE